MSRTVAQAFAELEKNKYTRAVWIELVGVLSGAIDEEVRSASKGITAEDCGGQLVPQKIIRDIIDEVNAQKIDPLDQRISEIENLSVEETKKDGEATNKKTVKGQKSKPKRVRAVRPTARKKAQNPS